MFLMSACHNLRMSGITENWIDWVLHPKWFFSYKSLLPDSKFFGNYGFEKFMNQIDMLDNQSYTFKSQFSRVL